MGGSSALHVCDAALPTIRLVPRTNVFITDHRYQLILMLWPEALYDLESFVTTHNAVICLTTFDCLRVIHTTNIYIQVRSRPKPITIDTY
jgi:hypothetical protein